ncbi:MAG TPA: 3-hydroxyacyl-CoA dehydrogenase family protein [Flavitalea sp.]|nr:3-hydroxyacyl-CoA dehydrogenase family protein [Flavitalea sp.]
MIETVCICGAGTMGRGIAQLIAGKGFRTILYDVDAEVLKRAERTIDEELQTLTDKNKITGDDKANTLAHLNFTTDINDCIADIIIEAIIERLPEKIALFNQLAEINHSETIFATNTSSLPVTSIAASVHHPERVSGMHFFNPAPLMKLLELISTPFTAASVTSQLTEFGINIGKTVVTSKDSPGFIVNRVARLFYLEALYLEEHFDVAITEIDSLMEATGFRMGPFALMDLIGNDINYAVSASLYEALGKPERLKPAALQLRKVLENELGKKTGKGYYNYNKE